MVLDPSNEEVATRYLGAPAIAQLRTFLEDGEKVVKGRAKSEASALLARGDKLAAANKNAEATKAYEEALSKAPKGWPSYGRAAESLVVALSMTDESSRCAMKALELLPRVRGTATAAGVAATGLGCATDLPEEDESRVKLIDTLEKATRAAFDDPKISMSGDDRSGVYMSLISAREAAKDEAGAQKLREEWSAFLEKEAARATTPQQRAVFDSHRVAAYQELKTPEKAIPMLEQSERDFPDDYNPPARLLVIYRTMKKYPEALAAAERALAKAYGPRKLLILRNKAETLNDAGDKAAAKATLAEAIAYAKTLPEEQRSARSITALEKRLAEL